jgi:hypothetical protein
MIWGWEGGGASEGQSMLLPAYWWTSVKSHTGLRRRHGAWQTDAWQNSLELAGAGAQPGPVEPKEPDAAAPRAGRELKGSR